MLDVLLISPYLLSQDPLEQKLMKPYPPLGLLYVAAALKPCFSVEILDLTFKDEQEVARTLSAKKPRIVGVTANVVCREVAGRAIKKAKAAGACVIAGGPDPSTYEELYLGEYGADYLVRGEAEITVKELVTTLLEGQASEEIQQIPGLVFLKEGKVTGSPARALVKELDSLPMPAWDLLDLEPYFSGWRNRWGYTSLHIMTSRGCPFSCNWCSKEIFARSFRQHSPQRVVDEMLLLRDHYGVDRLWLADDITGPNKKWMAKWHSEVLKRGAQIPFECLTRVDLVDETLIRQLKETGCWKIYYGAESGSQKVLNAMNKETTLEEIKNATRLTKAAGIKVGFFIMFGYPGESLEDIQLTEQMLAELKPDTAGFSVAYPLKGTLFYEQVKAQMSPQQHQWSSTNENRLLFQARYPNQFYNLTIRILQKKMALRQRKPLDPGKLLDYGKITLFKLKRIKVLRQSEKAQKVAAGKVEIPVVAKQ
ncbi:MAG TPA: radical SAM protein [Chloroflexia bacterium]|nr:radical SAM protein [Chloroflexia bacterium]